jgi:hypothetical protein
MAQVTLDGRDLGEVTDEALLAYYRREPGAVVDGTPTPVPAPEEVEAVQAETEPEPVEWPGKSATKAEKYAYAQTVDPDIEEYDDITAAELDERYAPAES